MRAFGSPNLSEVAWQPVRSSAAEPSLWLFQTRTRAVYGAASHQRSAPPLGGPTSQGNSIPSYVHSLEPEVHQHLKDSANLSLEPVMLRIRMIQKKMGAVQSRHAFVLDKVPC